MDCISSTTTSAPRRWLGRQAPLLPYHGVHEVEEGRAHQGGHVPSGLALGGGDEEDAALADDTPHVDGGAGLAQDGPRPLRRRVVGEAGLDRGQGVGAGLVPPAEEVPAPPLHQVWVAHLGQHVCAKVGVGEDAQPVEDGVLLARVPALVGLVKRLDGLLQDGLHPRPPLVPQPPGDAHHRVGGAVPVGEDAGVEEIDAGSAPPVGQIDEPYLACEGLRHVPKQVAHQVGVGIDDDDGVAVPARRLLLPSCA